VIVSHTVVHHDDVPLKIRSNLPSVINGKIDKPLTVELKGELTEDLLGPFTVVVVLKKEWFPGFWSLVPCINFTNKNW